MSIVDDLKHYGPFNKQEKKDVKYIIDFYRKYKGNIFTRDNEEGHMTSSCWVLNPEKTKVLMAYHNILKDYAWLGGHADGDTDLKAVAKRELMEETGVKNPKLLSPYIFSVEVVPYPEHIKKGKLVKRHNHLNITYLFEVDETETLKSKEDENKDVRWIETDKLFDYVRDESIAKQIYKKLMQKVSLSDTNYYDFIKEFIDDSQRRL